MGSVKKTVLLVLLLLNFCVCHTSCWNYREINNSNVVLGFGVDQNPSNSNYLVSMEFISSIKQPSGSIAQGGGGTTPRGGLSSETLQLTGETVSRAFKRLALVTGKAVYLGQDKILIISEALARRGIINLFDFIARNPKLRYEIQLLIAAKVRPIDIFKNVGQDSGRIVSLEIARFFEATEGVSIAKRSDYLTILNDLANPGRNPVIPIITIERDPSNPNFKISEMAVFKRDKMVGKLNEAESLMFLIAALKANNLNVPISKGENGIPVAISIFIEKTDVAQKIIERHGKPALRLDIKMEIQVEENMGTVDLLQKGAKVKLQKQLENYFDRRVSALIRKTQAYQSDIFGFGNTVSIQRPKLWKKAKERWAKVFQNLDIEARSKVRINITGLTQKPITVAK
jgi:spore germination protein KC